MIKLTNNLKTVQPQCIFTEIDTLVWFVFDLFLIY